MPVPGFRRPLLPNCTARREPSCKQHPLTHSRDTDCAVCRNRGGNMPSFYEDVIKNDARFNSAKRVADPELLEPVTRAAIANILQDARALGIELMVFETYRSQARQQELFNQGASKLRVVGVHHYGLACDLVKAIAGGAFLEGGLFFPRKACARSPVDLGWGLG